MITLTFTSTVAAGPIADTLTVTPTGATAATAGATSVTFEANAKAGTVKTLTFVADGSAGVSFTISGSVVDDSAAANAKIKTAVDALNALTEDQLKATASSSDFATSEILVKDDVTYSVKSATKDATAEVSGKTIKVTGASLEAGNTVKVIVTVSADNGTPQNVKLTLTLA